jgi:hypothetical protein
MKRLLLSTIALAAAAFGPAIVGTTSASAATVCFGGDNGPDTCTPNGEAKVFLEGASDVMTGLGNVGSQTGMPLVQFTSTDSLDFANGFATITPSAKGGKASFSNLDISVLGHTFTDLIFDLQMVKPKSGSPDLTIEAWDGSTLEGSFTYSASGTPPIVLNHDADISFIVEALSGTVLTKVDLFSTSGIKEAKHFEVSGVPELSTWAMMLVGFSGLGFAGYRKTRKAALFAG